MAVYYNEFDPKAAAWLRELIKQGHIAPGDVDERSIEDVAPDDLRPYNQCHFFAGIGVWSYALRRAGWHDERPVWTGSCPCQPFSAAGKGAGFADERHLWPAFHHLISVCRPPVVFGEQVASKDGLGWLDLVQADLEGSGYASGAVDTCAAGFGAPHIRQRLWWVAERVADASSEQHDRTWLRGARWRPEHPDGSAVGLAEHAPRDGRIERRAEPSRGSLAGGRGLGRVADLDDAGLEGRGQPGRGRAAERPVGPGGVAGGLADASGKRLRGELGQRVDPSCAPEGEAWERQRSGTDLGSRGPDGGPGPVNGLWRDADWLYCRDGKWRPVEPGTFPLAHRAPARMGHVCAACLEASAEGADYEDLCELREVSFGSDRCLPAEVLQPSVPVGGAEESSGDPGGGTVAGAEPLPEPPLRDLREGGGEPSTSSGRQPSEQRSEEHQDPLPTLPRSGTPRCERCGAESYVHEVRIEGAGRVARLRGYGNAIVAPAAQAFIEAYLDTLDA